MNNSDHIIAEFSQPDGENLFSASGNGLRTYGDLKKFQHFFLQFLFDFDHDFNKPVGFLSDSSDELIFAVAACWDLGIPFSCLNPSAPTVHIEEQINILKPGIIFSEDSYMQKLSFDDCISMGQLDLERSLSIKTELGFKAKSYAPRTDADDVFGYFFTSGTTGTPKIVPLKRRQMISAAKASEKNFKPRVNHFWLLCLPLNHIGGISIILRSILYGTGIYRMNKFNREMVSTFLTENKLFQAASLVPTMLKRLMEIPAFRTHDNFKAILLGGGPVDPDLLKKARQRGIPMVSSYGMTETCAQIAANPLLQPSGVYRPLKSVGKIFEPNSIEIRDEQNNKIGVNNSGMIWIKGPQVFDGYLNPDPPTLEFDEDGWFNTGDYGHLNANNHLFIESRRKDMIITGGENVSPNEVELELEKIDPISEAAVLGVDDKEWGQQVVAVVVAKTKDRLQTKDIQQKLRERVTAYKIPKKIVQADTIPRTESGKVKRSELEKMFAAK